MCCYRLLKSYEHSKVEFRYNAKNYTEKLISKSLKINKRSCK
ncbi:hypothetical protein CAMRE0001_0673 [Campylobacter rectus RM3267]|uniref:Uncharacterized protein n=1 Tax=Campylobacter rectus RM3267 TaxID=553218 RepID=B9D1L0_CAMRE|nr:hypothetical protein CAMRE0001_0673 [Campylobacter rectus RM3267]